MWPKGEIVLNTSCGEAWIGIITKAFLSELIEKAAYLGQSDSQYCSAFAIYSPSRADSFKAATRCPSQWGTAEQSKALSLLH